MKDRLLKVGEAAKKLAVTPQTVRKYRRQGKLIGYPTPGGQILYSEKEIDNYLKRLIGEKPKEEVEVKTVFYARSSTGSKKGLDSQIEKLRSLYGEPLYIIKDRSSGLNEKRPGLKRMVELAKEGKINRICITQKDRLSRFGNLYLKELFEAYNVSIEIAFSEPDKNLNEELMDDFMSLIASFSGKFYRLRGYKEKKKLLSEADRRVEESHESNNGDSN